MDEQKFERLGIAALIILLVAITFRQDIAGLWTGHPFPFYLPLAFIYFFIPWLVYTWFSMLWPKHRVAAALLSLAALILARTACPQLTQWLIPLPHAKQVVYYYVQQFFNKTVPLPEVRVGIPVMLVLYVFVMLTMYFHARRGGKKDAARPLFLNAAVTGIILGGLIVRWEALAIAIHLPLDPDAITYRLIADKMQHLYSTDFREPLWIWTIKLWFLVFGSSDNNLRILSVFLSVILLIAAWWFFSRLTRHTGISLLTLAILSVHSYLILMSVRGLRLELLTIALLILAFYTFVDDPGITPRARLLGLTLGGVLCVLQQMNTLTFVPLFWLYAFQRYRLTWWKLIAPFGATALFLTPYLVYCARVFGDPLWCMNVHAIWYRNYELMVIKKTGCPWYRSLAEFKRNSYLGPNITSFKYIFGMHSLPEVISRTANGYFSVFLKPDYYFWRQIGVESIFAYLTYLAGLITVIASPLRRVLLYPLLSVNLTAFLVPVGINARLVEHTAPISVWILASGIWLLVMKVSNWIKKRIIGRKEGMHQRLSNYEGR